MELFKWMPTSAELSRNPRVKSAQFGDGYGQDSPDGLNANLKTWELSFKVAPETAKAIDDFLTARGGAERFNFIDLRAETGVYVCKTWKVNSQSPKVMVTATFKEVAR